MHAGAAGPAGRNEQQALQAASEDVLVTGGRNALHLLQGKPAPTVLCWWQHLPTQTFLLCSFIGIHSSWALPSLRILHLHPQGTIDECPKLCL